MASVLVWVFLYPTQLKRCGNVSTETRLHTVKSTWPNEFDKRERRFKEYNSSGDKYSCEPKLFFIFFLLSLLLKLLDFMAWKNIIFPGHWGDHLPPKWKYLNLVQKTAEYGALHGASTGSYVSDIF